MDTIFNSFQKTVFHLQALHETFQEFHNYPKEDEHEFYIYNDNLERIRKSMTLLRYEELLYSSSGRQMILSDFYEYVLFGRIYYSLDSKEDRGHFIEAILSLVNILMCYETITVSTQLRNRFLEKLQTQINGVSKEKHFQELLDFPGQVGLPDSTARKELADYFDSLLPKTAGGLWHELLVYVFLLRNDVGYIIPLLLTQRFIGLHDCIVPPDFLILSKDKKLYGIEVGGFKERQSSNFVLRTAIPTASADTRNSRTDRCPICKKWINFCPFVIANYSNLDINIEKEEVRCMEKCTIFSPEDVASGKCEYTKYSRKRTQRGTETHHDYSTGYHYHYQCVLSQVSEEKKIEIVNSRDSVALKTHYPYYSGLEGLLDR